MSIRDRYRSGRDEPLSGQFFLAAQPPGNGRSAVPANETTQPVSYTHLAEQLRQLNKLTENIILEPAGRNTAPAIALAALAAKRHSPESDPLMLVLAADHVIADEDAFRAAVRNAMPYAEAGKLVTFGIVPDLSLIHLWWSGWWWRWRRWRWHKLSSPVAAVLWSRFRNI